MAVELNIMDARLFLHLKLAKAVVNFSKIKLVVDRLATNKGSSNRNSTQAKITDPLPDTARCIELLQKMKAHDIWRTHYNNNCFPEWDTRAPRTLLRNYASLTRGDMEIILRLRTRNFPIGSHREHFNKDSCPVNRSTFKCPYCQTIETEEHYLQRCRRYESIRPPNMAKARLKQLLNSPKNFKLVCNFVKQTEHFKTIKLKTPD